MTAVVATVVPTSIGKRWVRYTGGSSTEDNEVLATIDCEGAIEVIAHSILGTFDVFGSMDGTNFSAVALAMENMASTTPATRVTASTADTPVRITNPGFRFLRFMANTTTDVTSFSVAVRVK